MLSYLAVAVGGAVGASLRYGLNELAMNVLGKSFPFGTLISPFSLSVLWT